MRYTSRVLLLAVAVVAVGLTIPKFVYPGHHFFLGLYLALVATVVVGAIQTEGLFRPGFVGASVFGVLYLVCVLKGGFGIETMNEASRLTYNSKAGFALLGLSFLASQLLGLLIGRNGIERRQDRT